MRWAASDLKSWRPQDPGSLRHRKKSVACPGLRRRVLCFSDLCVADLRCCAGKSHVDSEKHVASSEDDSFQGRCSYWQAFLNI